MVGGPASMKEQLQEGWRWVDGRGIIAFGGGATNWLSLSGGKENRRGRMETIVGKIRCSCWRAVEMIG